MRTSTLRLFARIALLGLGVGVVLYSLFPLYWMIVSGVREEQSLFEPLLLPGPYSLRGYQTILSLTDFPTYYINSILVAVGTTLLTIAVVTPMAYALVRSRMPGMMLIVRAMLFAYMFPALLLAIPIYIFLVKVGWDDALSSLVLTYCSFTLPLGVWLMWGFFKNFPFEIEEAALVDGCSRLQAIYRVILPITLPGVLTVAIFSFLLAWSDFVFSLVLITSDSLKTLPYGLASMDDAYDANWGELMAGSTMIVLPLLVLFVFLGKYFIRGLSMGAVKS
jgi:multiple sugar transport system permease protein